MSTAMVALALVGWLLIGPVVAVVVCRVLDARDEQVPVDPAAVDADDQLLEDLRLGALPPSNDQIARALAAIRAECNEGLADA